jgi:hypothetical protein
MYASTRTRRSLERESFVPSLIVHVDAHGGPSEGLVDPLSSSNNTLPPEQCDPSATRREPAFEVSSVVQSISCAETLAFSCTEKGPTSKKPWPYVQALRLVEIGLVWKVQTQESVLITNGRLVGKYFHVQLLHFEP